mmetsp:Transcript_9390/g.42812  ORF Transcript_9390/g.42812 Transcript_9390/m.42812 type:complete len:207 (+) Transcript_9390:676-1296(+)
MGTPPRTRSPRSFEDHENAMKTQAVKKTRTTPAVRRRYPTDPRPPFPPRCPFRVHPRRPSRRLLVSCRPGSIASGAPAARALLRWPPRLWTPTRSAFPSRSRRTVARTARRASPARTAGPRAWRRRGGAACDGFVAESSRRPRRCYRVNCYRRRVAMGVRPSRAPPRARPRRPHPRRRPAASAVARTAPPPGSRPTSRTSASRREA